ncbi:MAG: reverse transcriptase [Alphaproteobacteria bacterium]|nr:reverse transcriptase [Alphaproteobacteria bacterium]
MKTYKNLWDTITSMENLELAAKKAVKSKKSKKAVKKFLKNKTEYLQKLQQQLKNGTFKTSKYFVFKVFEPKERDIYVLPLYPDHIVHHAIINVLGPIWHKMFIKDSYACIPGRGLHAASQRIMRFVKKNKFVLQCDVKKFFPSIDHQIMFDIIKRKIKDKPLLDLLRNIIDSCGDKQNLPIGNLTSQWMGNLYLNELDYFVKHVLKCRCYIRYCDDFCVFADDKKILRSMQFKIQDFLWIKLNLKFSKVSLTPTACGVNFIGYRHYKRFVLLRPSSKRRITRKLMIIAVIKNITLRVRSQIAALGGWIKWANCFNLKTNLFARYKIAL